MRSKETPRSSLPAPTILALAVRAALGGALLLGATTAIGADWLFDPKLTLSAEYDDNNRMSAVRGQEIEVYGPKIDAQVLIRARTPRTTFSLIPRFSSTFYVEGEEDDADNGYLNLALDHKGERSNAYLDASYSSVVTLGRFFPSSQLGDPSETFDPLLGDPDPGVSVPLVATRNRQDRFLVSPGFSFELAERHSTGLGARYLDVDYDIDQLDKQDYSNVSVFGNYGFKTSKTGTLGVVATFSQFEPTDGDSTDYWALNAEWTKRWSETAEAYLRAGSSFVEVSQGGGSQGSSWENGFAGGAGVRWQFEVSSIFLDLNQYVDPNSYGSIVTRIQLRAEYAHKLTPTTTLTLAARGFDDSAPPGDKTYVGQQYATGDVGLRWRFSRQFMLYGVYQYRWKEREEAVNDAQSNAVSLGVTWEPKRK